MPHSGARGSPLTEVRVPDALAPQIASAAAMVAPFSTSIDWPSIVRRTRERSASRMARSEFETRGEKRLDGNRGYRLRDLRGEQLRGAERCRHAKPFVTDGEPHARRGIAGGADQRHAIGR